MKELDAYNRNIVKVTKALNLIWNNVEHELNLDIISRSCNVSKFHFHRIFLEHQGESLGSYISRKRLERAANRLILFPHHNISQIASSLGYSSPANFSKAFNKYTGMSPKQWRFIELQDSIGNGVLNSKYGKVLNPELVYSKYKFKSKDERYERLNDLDKIISIRCMNSQCLMYLSTKIGHGHTLWEQIWEKMNIWITNNVSDQSIHRFGVWYDNKDICPDELMRYDAAIKIPESLNVKAPFMKQKMEAGYYATGILCGTPEDIRNALKDIYLFWFVDRGFVPDIKPYYEEYLSDVNENGHYQIQFYVKLTSNRKL